ncbi:MAG: S41 family peptidase [Hellea sp.]
MPKMFLIKLVTVICLAACASQPQTPAHEWGKTTQSDLKIAHQMMQENHPGAMDVQNPDFNKTADKSFDNAMKMAIGVTSQAGYAATMLAYTSGFRDGHFGVYATAQNTGEAPINWPGMLPAWRADSVRIAHAEPEESHLLGAEMLSCDGRKPSDLIRENVFQFNSGKPSQESYWARYAHSLFLDRENPLMSRPDKCDFHLTSGETITHVLKWRRAPNRVFSSLRLKAAFGARPSIGMEEMSPGNFWINLPEFSPNDEGIRQYRALFTQIINRREEMQNAKSIVFDMRGNRGGSGAWGLEMIEALWGEDYFKAQSTEDNSYVEWRLSKENVEHLDWIVNYLIENGQEDLADEYVRPIQKGALKAYAEGKDFYRESEANNNETNVNNDKSAKDVTKPNNPVKTPTYVLTHGSCASACLDFVDLLFDMGGVTHIGYPTGSDTNYMEVREVKLPSGLATMTIPTKVYRNRSRPSGAFYEPVHRYDGFDWSNKAIHDWAKTIIER